MIAQRTNTELDASDAELMVRVRDGENEAFDRLMKRYERRVVGFIASVIGRSVDAEDLSQQVFYRAFRARQGYEPSAAFSAWLFTIARNVVSNTRRGLTREGIAMRALHSRTDASDSMIDIGPCDEVLKEERRREVNVAISQLPERQQQALQLVCLRGHSYRSAGAMMNVSLPAIKSLVCRAKVSLRRILDGDQTFSQSEQPLIRKTPSF